MKIADASQPLASTHLHTHIQIPTHTCYHTCGHAYRYTLHKVAQKSIESMDSPYLTRVLLCGPVNPPTLTFNLE